MNLKPNCYAIGFYSFMDVPVKKTEYARYFSLFEELLVSLGVTPTYYGIAGNDYPEKLIKIDNEGQLKKLKSNDFDGVDGFTFIVNPTDSDSPSYDHFIYLDIDYIEREGQLTVAIVINETFITSSEFIESLFIKFNSVNAIDYGYASIVSKNTKPELPILGIESDYLDNDEKMSLYKWYDASSIDKKERIRHVYHYNFLNKTQRGNLISAGCTVENYINEKFASNRFYEIDKTEMYILKVDNSEIATTASDIRQALI